MRSFPINPKRTAPETQGEFELLQVLGVLRRGKWAIFACTLAMILLGGYYAFRMATPLYTTVATVALQNRSEKIVDFASPLSALGGDYFSINTEVEAMAARGLIAKLVDKLDLTADPVFNHMLRPAEDGWSLAGTIAAVRALIAPPEAVLAVEITPAQIREEVINAVRGAIEIHNKDSSYVFYISVTTPDPAASLRVANGLARVYVEDQIALKYEATEQATNWLNTRVAELKLELEAAENAVKAFSTSTNLVAPEVLEALNRQLKDRRDRIVDARAGAGALAARAADLAAAGRTGDPAVMAAAAGDQTLDQLIDRLDQPGMRQAFDTRYGRIVERARLEAEQSGAKIVALERSVTGLEAQIKRQSAELLKLQQYEREAAASRQIYEYFLGRLKEISVQQGIHRADSRILSDAVLPLIPSSPRKMLILAAMAVLGLLIGSALVLLREMRQSGIRSPQDLELVSGLTVMGQIPKAPVSKRRRLIRYLIAKSASALSEAVRNLRTSVMLSNIDQPPQIILVTSSLPGEGKTTLSIALARSYAGMGRSVLLIEGDIRRRTFREYFRMRGDVGLIRAVMQDAPFEDVVHHSPELGIDILAGEKSSVNAADFFASARVGAFFERARAAYDIVIIDTPPVLVVPDARVIGHHADAVLYTVRWDRTTRAQIQEGIGALTSVDVAVSGLVLSQIDTRKAARYGGYYGDLYKNYGTRYYRN